MATQLDSNVKDDLKTQFVTREGTYRLLTLPEYSRPNRVGYTNNQSSPQVRVSIVTLPTITAPNPHNNGANYCSHNTNNYNHNTNTNSNNTNNNSNNNHNNCNNQSQTHLINGTNCSTITTATTANGMKASGSSNTGYSTNTGGTDSLDGVTDHHQSSMPNVHNQTAFVVPPATMDARLGAGISMHTIMNGGSNAGGNGIEQNGLSTNATTSANQIYGGDRICFNFGRELYVYSFRGVKKGAELTKPIDKKFYKGTNPSCHDFNAATATATGAPLLVGFTTGQIQLVSPQLGPRELRKLYNEERLIDKTKVTCLKWLPNSPNLFLASHASGHLYLYNEDLPCTTTAPNYQPFKMGDGYSILTCKSKTTRNPLYKWVFTTENCCINEFCFSPCGSHLAIVSQDGFLRVFHYDTMELLGIARSYFGGFLCVCWSPDGKYIVVGGEDDLVTVWSFHERRVVARGQGHRSWVSVVAFDPYTTSYTSWDGGDFSDDENQMSDYVRFPGTTCDSMVAVSTNGFDQLGGSAAIANDRNTAAIQSKQQLQQQQRPHSTSFRSDCSSSLTNDRLTISYRLGSVSQDTQICLWDITEDVLRHPLPLKQRVNSSNYNDSSFMNGIIDNDGIKFIRPVAMSSLTGSFPAQQHCNNVPITNSNFKSNNSNIKESASSTDGEHNDNSGSKFFTENCTISSQSSSANTPCDDININPLTHQSGGKSYKAVSGGGGSSTLKFPNCISATKSDSIDANLNNTAHIKNHHYSSSTSSTSGYNSKNSDNNSGNGSGSGSGSAGILAFNTLSQKFSNFNFLNNSEKKGNSSIHLEKNGNNNSGGSVTMQTRHNRKGLNLLKSYSNQHQLVNHQQNYANSMQIDNSSSGSAHTFGSLKLGKSSGHHFSMKTMVGGGTGATAAAVATTIATTNTSLLTSATHSSAPLGTMITTYDPLKLIGTPACPRFDECPILEPLVCKKIAHERLSALIFREDCFLTACQDGFIYTWARPGYVTNITQHLSPGQVASSGGTVT